VLVRGSNFAALVAGFPDFAALVLGGLRFARREATSLRLCRLCRRRAGGGKLRCARCGLPGLRCAGP